jgi:hypothetical protein
MRLTDFSLVERDTLSHLAVARTGTDEGWRRPATREHEAAMRTLVTCGLAEWQRVGGHISFRALDEGVELARRHVHGRLKLAPRKPR